MQLTYSKVMARVPYLQALKFMPYTGYSAILYARWLPFAVLIPILAAVGMVLSLFLPWLSLGNTDVIKNPMTHNGFQIASSGATLGNDTFSFPLWLLVLLGIALVVLSLRLLKDKVLTPLLSLSIKLTFGLALLVEIVYWFISQFIITQGRPLAIGPSYGLWVCLAVTCIAGGACLILFSELSWYWTLAQTAVEEVERRTKFRPI